MVIVVALTLCAAGAEQLAHGLWLKYSQFQPLLLAPILGAAAGSPPPLPSAQPALSSRILLICVRGLRADLAQNLSSLNALRERGADYILQLDEPLFSRPQMMTLLSGATPEFHGLTADEMPSFTADHIFARAATTGLNTALIGDPWWEGRLGRRVQFEANDINALSERDTNSIRSALAQFSEPTNRINLMWLELRLLADVAAVEPGDRDKAITSTDAQLTALLRQIDLSKITVIVTADRGLLDSNTDGAEVIASHVPLIMAGPGIRGGAKGATRSINFASTLATLLGAQTPAQSQGTPLYTALLVPPQQLDLHVNGQAARLVALYERWAETHQRPRFASEVLQSLDSVSHNDPARWLRNFEQALNQRYERERNADLAAGEWHRLPFVIGLLLCALAIAGALASPHQFLPLLCAPAFWLLWLAMFRVAEPVRDTLSNFGDGDANAFLSHMLRNGTLIWIPTLLGIVWVASRHRDAMSGLVWGTSGIFIIVLTQGALVALFGVRWGLSFERALPDGGALSQTVLILQHIAALNAPVPGVPFRVPLALVAAAFTMVMSALRGGGRNQR